MTARFRPSATQTCRPAPVIEGVQRKPLFGFKSVPGERARGQSRTVVLPSLSISWTPPGMPTHSLPLSEYWVSGSPSIPTVCTTCNRSGSIAMAVRAGQLNTQIWSPFAVTFVGAKPIGTFPTGLPDFGSSTAIEFATSRTGFADAEPVVRSTAAVAPPAMTNAAATSTRRARRLRPCWTVRGGGNRSCSPEATTWYRRTGSSMSFNRCTPRLRSDTPVGRSSATSARAVSDTKTCPPCAAAPTRAARCTPIPTYLSSPVFGSLLCNPMRTRTCTCSGQSCAARLSWASIAAETASRAERKAQNSESPCVSTTRPPCASTEARSTSACSAKTSP